MQRLPLVSIVTPAYNQARYLPETIESVLAQDYSNLEYIVIDDGSTDETPIILERYGKYIHHERQENSGQANTLNRGWGIAKGTLIGYLSADDILYPDALSRLVAVLASDESIACAFPDVDLIDEHSRVTKKNICQRFDLGDLIVRQECYIGPGALFRKSDFEKIGGWRGELKLAPDREFWIRLAARGRIEMYPQVLAGYRMHPHSISYKYVSEEVSREYLNVLDNYFDSSPVPAHIASRRDEAYGYANLLIARNCFRAGSIRCGMRYYDEACNYHDELRSARFKVRILRNVISRPLRTIFSALLSLAERLRR